MIYNYNIPVSNILENQKFAFKKNAKKNAKKI